jgi:hypothetical protein
MEPQIHPQRQLQLLRHHELGINCPDAPVEHADEDLERGAADGEGVFQGEEEGHVENVGDEGGDVGECGDEEADYC